MIFLLHGADEFRIFNRVSDFNKNFIQPELKEANVVTMDMNSCSFDQIVPALFAIPFLADKRIVFVENFSRHFVESTNSQIQKIFGEWSSMEDLLKAIPSTTDLVIIEGDLSHQDGLLKLIQNVGQIEYYPALRGGQLLNWIKDEAKKLRIVIEKDAEQLLADSIGSDLRIMESEMNKLALYKGSDPITREDVSMMVHFVREQSVFEVVDSAILGDKASSLKFAKMLVSSGTSPVTLSRLIERQIRLLLLSKSLLQSGQSNGAISRRLSLFGYPLQKTINMGSRIEWNRLVELHNLVLEYDLKIRNGLLSDEKALEWLIIEMSS